MTRQPRRAGRGLVLAVAAGLVLTLLGGVTAAANAVLSGGGPQPESYAPASAFAFAKLDLDPAARQKLAVLQLSRRFPSSPTRTGTGDVRDQLLRPVFRDSDPPVDYDRDVKPWLGKRVGIAGFLDSAGKPQVVGILAYTDKDAARRGMDRLIAADRPGHRSGYSLQDGFAVLGDTQPTVDAAVAAAAKRSLADVRSYRDDIGSLTGDQVATGWIDVRRSVAAARVPLSGGTPGGSSGLPEQLLADAKGRLVVGVHAASAYLEIEGRTVGVDTPRPAAGSRRLLTGLPEGTVAAVTLSEPGQALTRGFEQLRRTPGMDSFTEVLDGIGRESGLALPDDIGRLLGDQAVLALGSPPGGDAPPTVGLRSHPQAPAAGQAVAAKIAAYAGQQGLSLVTRSAGGDQILATTPAFADRLAGGGRLGESALFRTAMGPLPAETAFAAYADLSQLVPKAVDQPDVRALRAFGMSLGRSGKQDVLRIRIVAG